MSGWFTTADGRRFSPEQRKASSRLTRAAIARGEIPAPVKCNRCGQTEGYVSYHNHDYAHPTKYLECLCWRCHAMWHSQHFAKEAVDLYFEEVAKGRTWPPLPRPGWGQLRRDHGVGTPPRQKRRQVPEQPELPGEPPWSCGRCGQAAGIRRYWWDQGTAPELTCWWCWAMLCKGTMPEYQLPAARYWKAVKAGYRQPPVTAPRWDLMAEIYGIPEGPPAPRLGT